MILMTFPRFRYFFFSGEGAREGVENLQILIKMTPKGFRTPTKKRKIKIPVSKNKMLGIA